VENLARILPFLALKVSAEYWGNCFYDVGTALRTPYGKPARSTSDVLLQGALDATGNRWWGGLPSHILKNAAQRMIYAKQLSPYGDDYYKELRELDLEGKTALEFGCGAGADALLLTQLGANVVAVDICPSNCEVTSRVLADSPKDNNVFLLTDYGQMDILPLVDVILAHGVIHHITDKWDQYVVDKLKERLLPGGYFVLMLYTRKFYKAPIAWGEEGPFTRGYSKAQTRELMTGMELVSYREVMDGTFAWSVFKKT